MPHDISRPFFSINMLLIAVLVVSGALAISQLLVAALERLLFG